MGADSSEERFLDIPNDTSDPLINDATYLTFFSNDTRYAIDLGSVQEIRRLGSVTSLPRSPEEIIGLINIRGNLVHVVDFDFLMNARRRVPSERAVVILVAMPSNIVGLAVDAAGDILSVKLDGRSSIGTPQGTSGLNHIVELIYEDDRPICVVDIESLLGAVA
ncbi:chemotaxis protein CheW [Jannaschia aquimarina]|uniref:chemotaxis protein CheW n=1 Tax=Jannaschia aquimarina TaxID=935700 RepID=UPI00137913D6|nr:chemotaxis protein CheW [Jannaschia aquimarina]